MNPFAMAGGLLLILFVLLDAFETVVLPRRVSRRVRLARLFYALTWRPWAAVARGLPPGERRESYLSFYGPLSLPLLLGLWALILVIGFATLLWSFGSGLSGPDGAPDFGTLLYMSGTTFFTLGLGDVLPRTPAARAITVAEGATGFAFLALIISYLPVLYQSFATRETNVSLLDQRAGSPPSAVELLRRNVRDGDVELLAQFLLDWERWSAELLETHLSYSALAYFRSQHDNQSWLAGLTVILDACTLVLAGVGRGRLTRQAQFTFAIARHAAADLSQTLGVRPRAVAVDRLPPGGTSELWVALAHTGVPLPADTPTAERLLAMLRGTYEPYTAALAQHLLMPLPEWLPPADSHDNWETTAWDTVKHTGLPSCQANEPMVPGTTTRPVPGRRAAPPDN